MIIVYMMDIFILFPFDWYRYLFGYNHCCI